jgi:SSS family solute:Na+ symporter
MFWQRMSARGALAAAIGSFVLSLAGKLFWPELPFMDRVGLVFIACVLIGVVVSLAGSPSIEKKHEMVTRGEVDFSTTRSFNIATVGIIAILAALYATWW